METSKFPLRFAYGFCQELHHPKAIYQLASESSRNLYHDCTFTDHPFMNIEIRTMMFLDDKTGSLRLRSRCTFNALPRKESVSWIQSHPLCPHEDIGHWLQRLFDEAGSDFNILNGHIGDDSCSFSYGWDNYKKSDFGEGLCSLHISWERNLGARQEWPERSVHEFFREYDDMV